MATMNQKLPSLVCVLIYVIGIQNAVLSSPIPGLMKEFVDHKCSFPSFDFLITNIIKQDEVCNGTQDSGKNGVFLLCKYLLLAQNMSCHISMDEEKLNQSFKNYKKDVFCASVKSQYLDPQLQFTRCLEICDENGDENQTAVKLCKILNLYYTALLEKQPSRTGTSGAGSLKNGEDTPGIISSKKPSTVPQESKIHPVKSTSVENLNIEDNVETKEVKNAEVSVHSNNTAAELKVNKEEMASKPSTKLPVAIESNIKTTTLTETSKSSVSSPSQIPVNSVKPDISKTEVPAKENLTTVVSDLPSSKKDSANESKSGPSSGGRGVSDKNRTPSGQEGSFHADLSKSGARGSSNSSISPTDTGGSSKKDASLNSTGGSSNMGGSQTSNGGSSSVHESPSGSGETSRIGGSHTSNVGTERGGSSGTGGLPAGTGESLNASGAPIGTAGTLSKGGPQASSGGTSNVNVSLSGTGGTSKMGVLSAGTGGSLSANGSTSSTRVSTNLGGSPTDTGGSSDISGSPTGTGGTSRIGGSQTGTGGSANASDSSTGTRGSLRTGGGSANAGNSPTGTKGSSRTGVQPTSIGGSANAGDSPSGIEGSSRTGGSQTGTEGSSNASGSLSSSGGSSDTGRFPIETKPGQTGAGKSSDNDVGDNWKSSYENTDYKNKVGVSNAVQGDSYNEPSSGNFMAYFLTAVVLCVAGYVLFHNKQKIVAFIIEGRNGRRTSRRPKTSDYKKLQTNVEEVMPSLEKSTTGSKYVY